MSTSELEDAYGHISTHDKDCLILRTQIGRYGFERVRTYTLFGEGADMSNVRFDCVD